MVRALVQQMVYEDPVVYDWANIKAKALELGGDKDGPNFPSSLNMWRTRSRGASSC